MWRNEMLIYPAVKRAVSILAHVTAWGYVLLALLWLLGLALVLAAAGLNWSHGAPVFFEQGLAWVFGARAILESLLLLCLYLLALWCHLVLLAGRGVAVTRWLLLFLLIFAFLHPVCVLYVCLLGKPLLVNQFLLPAVLYTSLAAVYIFNWFCMAALALRWRLCLLAFVACLSEQYILGGSVLLLLLPWLSFVPLRRLARLAPLVVSLPTKAQTPAASS